MTSRLLSILALGMACIWSVACDEKLSTIAGPTPNLEPTFAAVKSNIFQATDSSGRKPCTDCHTSLGRNPAGGLDLTPNVADQQLINVAVRGKPGAIRVIPGDPDNSYLIQKLEGAPSIVGSRMPINGPYLTDGQIKIIRRWIEIGAPR